MRRGGGEGEVLCVTHFPSGRLAGLHRAEFREGGDELHRVAGSSRHIASIFS